MKTFKQFVENYAAKVNLIRQKQQANLDAQRQRTQQSLQDRKDAEDRVKQVEIIRNQVKKEYGIRD